MRSIKRFAVLSLCAFLAAGFFAAPAGAKNCYAPAELTAEQTVRLHSELLVVALSCRLSSQGVSLTDAYGAFTKKHLKKIQAAERALMTHYGNNGKGKAERQMDRLRTEMGNEYSQTLASMKAPSFCGQYRDRVILANSWSDDQLNGELQRLATIFPSREPLCGPVKAEANIQR